MSAFPSWSAADDYGVRVRICVLGGCRVLDDAGADLDLGSRKPRSVVAALALTPGPAGVGRRAGRPGLGRRAAADRPGLVARVPLRVAPRARARAGRSAAPPRSSRPPTTATSCGCRPRRSTRTRSPRRCARPVGCWRRWRRSSTTGPDPTGRRASRSSAAVDRLDAALATWAGEPYADLPDHPDVQAERSSLEQLRAGAEEARLLGLLAVGDHAGVLATTESATARHPLREGLWATHALALARAGRQADALEALRTVRTTLAEELGIDPGPRLRALESAVLRQSPEIERTLSAPASPPRPRPPRRRGPTYRRQVPTRSAARPSAAALTALLDGGGRGPLHLRPRSWGSPASARPGSSTTWPSEARRARASPSPSAGARRTTERRRCGRGVRCSRPWGSRTAEEEPVDGPELDAGAGRVRPVGRHRAPGGRRGRRPPRCWSCSRTCTGPTRPPCARWPTCWPPPPPDARLCVVGTRRAQPEPAGALALVGESFARRHAARVDVAGLEPRGHRRPARRRGRGRAGAAARRLARPLGRQPVLPRRAGPAGSRRPRPACRRPCVTW